MNQNNTQPKETTVRLNYALYKELRNLVDQINYRCELSGREKATTNDVIACLIDSFKMADEKGKLTFAVGDKIKDKKSRRAH